MHCRCNFHWFASIRFDLYWIWLSLQAPGPVSQEQLHIIQNENTGLKVSSCAFATSRDWVLQAQLEELRQKMGASLSERYVTQQKSTAKVMQEHDRLRKDLIKVIENLLDNETSAFISGKRHQWTVDAENSRAGIKRWEIRQRPACYQKWASCFSWFYRMLMAGINYLFFGNCKLQAAAITLLTAVHRSTYSCIRDF